MTAPTATPPPPPRWAWCNLTAAEADDLDDHIQQWIDDYNRNLAVKMEHFIPACWRQHPALTQELAVQYHGWGYIHRRPDATALEALDYYTRTLPSFRQRVGDLLAPDASKCRMGRHPEPVPVLADAIDRAATDLDARGPDITDVLIGTSFGY